jgi:hypothetical protein
MLNHANLHSNEMGLPNDSLDCDFASAGGLSHGRQDDIVIA